MLDAALGLLLDSWAAALVSLQALLPIAAAFLLLGLIVKGPSVLDDMRRAAGEAGLNLQILVFNLVLFGMVSAPLAQGLVTIFVQGGWSLVDPAHWQALPGWAVILAGVVIGDFVGYWRHRLEHTWLLWPGHAVHHSDTHATWLTSDRVHPINRLVTFVADTGVLLLLGLPAEAIIASAMVRKNYGYVLHADLPWTFGLLGAVFVSPAMHRWHHSVERVAHDTNFAIVFSIFDRIFGTLRVPGPCDTALGVSDPIPAGLAGHLAWPFTRRAYRMPEGPLPAAHPPGAAASVHADRGEIMRARQIEGERPVRDQGQLPAVGTVN